MIQIRQAENELPGDLLSGTLGIHAASSAADMPNTVCACPGCPCEWLYERIGDSPLVQNRCCGTAFVKERAVLRIYAVVRSALELNG
jgi:hypothetical protein